MKWPAKVWSKEKGVYLQQYRDFYENPVYGVKGAFTNWQRVGAAVYC